MGIYVTMFKLQILLFSNAFYRGLTDLISPSWLKLFNASEFNQVSSFLSILKCFLCELNISSSLLHKVQQNSIFTKIMCCIREACLNQEAVAHSFTTINLRQIILKILSVEFTFYSKISEIFKNAVAFRWQLRY